MRGPFWSCRALVVRQIGIWRRSRRKSKSPTAARRIQGRRSSRGKAGRLRGRVGRPDHDHAGHSESATQTGQNSSTQSRSSHEEVVTDACTCLHALAPSQARRMPLRIHESFTGVRFSRAFGPTSARTVAEMGVTSVQVQPQELLPAVRLPESRQRIELRQHRGALRCLAIIERVRGRLRRRAPSGAGSCAATRASVSLRHAHRGGRQAPREWRARGHGERGSGGP